jgi:hypothetical protein
MSCFPIANGNDIGQTITLKNHHNKYGSAYRSDGRRSQVNPTTMPIYTPPYYSLQSPKLAQIQAPPEHYNGT